jgi:hypothetical protein
MYVPVSHIHHERCLWPGRQIAGFAALGRRRNRKVAVLEEVPDSSQMYGPICVLGPERSNVASPQDSLKSRIQRLSRHFPSAPLAHFSGAADDYLTGARTWKPLVDDRFVTNP